MNILSLFDGMSCGQIALRELGIKVDKYFASEIDKHAIAQTQLNFPETIQLGSVTEVKATDLPPIDMLIGGSPCQGFSFAGKQLNFSDPRSVLFFEYVRILKEIKEINPNVLFLLENVRMKRQFEAVISEQLGLQPVMINSALVSTQNRVRLYWTNIRTRKEGLFSELYTDIPQPKDKGLLLQDILEPNVPERYYLSDKTPTLTANAWEQNNLVVSGTFRTHKDDFGFREIKSGKAATIPARAREDGSGQNVCKINHRIRRLTPIECSRLQTIPSWYNWGCSETQIYKMLGNGWTVDVIKHIFKYINQ
ncbi:MAG: DNA (cytosine-5-)-methyltransferase [Clostridia bacterium]|nr:DNA (cytosine-5-)-methyltransferase [Clostridia bacterium]